ncbi:adenosine deaminase [Vibrio fluvialis]|jgi:adenosine deaminase|uniref:adenosine deaminase n=1 Tax=Vibrio fluvialis TaxID=676 RepID=UPI001C9C1C4A|nr:adenosine deaminase [Vibrio fluvialis]EKO3394679.1 adenosine deaminase [Vibrio fluvialis]EKO3907207.1 adenosine deaminase [Vibrio fluvialis]MBY8023618.1 adenosine deaminase [Vibrio fluvialis]MBY8138179.1 adenosine deaminase [Vibrio fluvialis]MCE7660415.1 adenosine deaminase [Vibrio fluvialis]
MKEFIQQLPKVELHLHIEGSLEPELMFDLAQRNQIAIPFSSPDEVRAAYQFSNLQSFLDIYYQGANVLIHEQDFFDLTWAYLLRCQQDNVMHTEIFFDPQTHTARGIAFETVINGITQALEKGQQELGISSQLIMCFLRHLSEADAMLTLQQALPYKDKIVGVGLDSSEQGHPPEKFQQVFRQAREAGFITVAHAGEEGPALNIRNAIDLLGVQRVDHGVRCVEDAALVQELKQTRMPLTVCPLSNLKLKVFTEMEQHNIVDLLRQGLCVTINSDDPAYFGGYMTDNFMAVANAHPMSHQELAQFTLNAIEASFISAEDKARMSAKVHEVLARFA